LDWEEEGRRPVVPATQRCQGCVTVVVALITRSIRGIDTEVEIGPEDGMPVICAISLDNLRTVPQALLVASITELGSAKMDEVCRALVRSTGC
jgi:mRNA interferase MazF